MIRAFAFRSSAWPRPSPKTFSRRRRNPPGNTAIALMNLSVRLRTTRVSGRKSAQVRPRQEITCKRRKGEGKQVCKTLVSRTPPVCTARLPGGFCYFWAIILQPEVDPTWQRPSSPRTGREGPVATEPKVRFRETRQCNQLKSLGNAENLRMMQNAGIPPRTSVLRL
jgi:hypothetical protein